MLSRVSLLLLSHCWVLSRLLSTQAILRRTPQLWQSPLWITFTIIFIIIIVNIATHYQHHQWFIILIFFLRLQKWENSNDKSWYMFNIFSDQDDPIHFHVYIVKCTCTLHKCKMHNISCKLHIAYNTHCIWHDTHPQLPIAHCQLPIAHCKFTIASCSV